MFDPPIYPDFVDKDSHQWAEFNCTIEELIAALLGSQLELCYLSVPAVEFFLEFSPGDSGFVQMKIF